jgi:transcription antitermination factor NusA-like protein
MSFFSLKSQYDNIKKKVDHMKLDLIEAKGSKSSETLMVKENLTTLTVSGQDGWLIIGKQGTNINRITKETGVYISVEDQVKGRQDKLVELWGENASVDKALEMINETLMGKENLTTLNVSANDARLIIGNQGTNINRIIEQTGVNILVRDSVKGRRDRLVELWGEEKASVDKALEMINVTLIAKENLTTLTVSDYDSGLILGSQGTNINRITKQTGVYISVRDPVKRRRDRVLELWGEEKASVDKALEMINETLISKENMTTLTVSDYDPGLIIGNKGTNINRIREQTGVYISVRDPVKGRQDRLVELWAEEKASVDKALEMINETLIAKENLTTLAVSDNDATLILGNQGTIIKSIKKETGVYISVRDPVKGSQDRLVELWGEKTSVDKALEMINETLMAKENLTTLAVSDNDATLILGNQGTIIKRIKKETGVYISVRDPVKGSQDRLVELWGEKTSVDKALEMIKENQELENESKDDIQAKTETSINPEKNIEETDLKPSAGNKVNTGNKVGDLQEFCRGHGIEMPNYIDGETTGPPHMRCFTMICVVGSAQRVGGGGTKKEAKHQAAGAVLEDLSTPAENQDSNENNLEETSGKDFKVDGKKPEKHQNNEEWEIIDGAKDINGDTNGSTRYV